MPYTNPLQILIRRSEALGDVVLTTPIIHQLNLKHQGNALIDVLTGFPAVFDNNPAVRSAGRQLPQRRYDLIYDLDLAYEMNPKMHILHAFSRKVFGESTFDLQPRIYPTRHDRLKIARLPELRHDNFMLLHMRNEPTWPSRHMGEAWWRSLCGLLETLGVQIVQVGRDPDYIFPELKNTLVLNNKLSLQEFVELSRYAKLFLGFDSSLMHLAAATDCPIMGIFTSASDEYRKPLRSTGKFFVIKPAIDCYGCQHDEPAPIMGYKCRRGDLACLRLLNPNSIFESVRQALA